jgi:hypothetical protein
MPPHVHWPRHITTPDAKAKNSGGLRGKDAGLTYKFTAYPELDPGATIIILQAGYPRVQAPSQRRKQGMQPRIAACPRVLDPSSLHGRASVLPYVPWLQTLPPSSIGLRCRHASHGSGPYLPTREGSDATMCLMAPDHDSLLERSLALPCVPQLQTPSPCSESSSAATCLTSIRGA